MLTIRVAPHAELALAAFVTELPCALGEWPSPEWLTERLALDATSPITRDDDVRAAIRDMMRIGGYKPTGRGKPASEYLVRAAGEPDGLRSINAVVDACNVVSLHSGVPISVIDPDRARPPFTIGIAPPETSYVFNASGQEMRVDGLVVLFDADGPCANGVKDSQRTKTHDATTRTLSILWGARSLGDHTHRAAAWYRELLAELGARTEDVELLD
ncbi:MAG: phenylalanine--tRNA ligase beta subunit-related protein [bacterium]